MSRVTLTVGPVRSEPSQKKKLELSEVVEPTFFLIGYDSKPNYVFLDSFNIDGGEQLQGSIIMLGVPYNLERVDAKTGNYDLIVRLNGGIEAATHLNTQALWQAKGVQNLEWYLTPEDLRKVKNMPLLRHTNGIPLEFMINYENKADEVIYIKGPLDINELTKQVIRVEFDKYWDERGGLKGSPTKIMTSDGQIYSFNNVSLSLEECRKLQEMIKHASNYKGNPGFVEKTGISAIHLTNYMKVNHRNAH